MRILYKCGDYYPYIRRLKFLTNSFRQPVKMTFLSAVVLLSLLAYNFCEGNHEFLFRLRDRMQE